VMLVRSAASKRCVCDQTTEALGLGETLDFPELVNLISFSNATSTRHPFPRAANPLPPKQSSDLINECKNGLVPLLYVKQSCGKEVYRA